MRSFFLLLALLCTSCIVPAPSTESSPEKAKVVVANTQPLQLKNGANLGDKIELTGLIVNPGAAAPGDTVKVSAFYKVLDEMTIDYAVFTHVEDVDGRIDRINVDHPPAAGQYPT